MSELIGKKLGKYRIEAEIGSGGMAKVYKAYHPGLDRYVAIKTLHRYLATESDYAERFKREAEAVALLRHPNIVQVYDFDSEGDLLYMVMELIEGPTLKDILHDKQLKNEEFSIEEIAKIFSDLGSAMDYAHRHNVIHRDLKPANIMFAQDGQAVVADFGISRILGSTRYTLPGSVTGTPDYMAPETCLGEGGNQSCDIYSLGVILYQIVTGRVPFEADTPMEVLLQHISSPVPPPSLIKPNIPKPLEHIILKAMNKSPAERYQSAGLMAQAIRVVAGLASADEPERPTNQLSEELIQTEPLSISEPPKPTPHQSTYPQTPAFQAPRDVFNFVGRESEIHQISQHLCQPQDQNILCLVGMGGIGKTALAIHLAHTLRDHFSDGILWANVALSQPLAILDSWAQALGLNFSHLPDIASRSAALRGQLVGKRILIVLDDVPTANGVQYLLPSNAECSVLITSRNSDLPIALGAHKVEMQTLSVEACQNLLKKILGEVRFEKEAEDDIRDLIEVLGRLPLAVEIAARRLASRPRWKVASLIERLQNQQTRLDELVVSDRAVRSSFAISWEALNKQQQWIFALLGVFEGRAFRASALAATAEISREEADDYLHELSALSLVAEKGKNHYQQHPLLANFSQEKLGVDEKAAVRMAGHYLAYTQQNQDDYLALEEEWDNLKAGLQITHQQKIYADLLSFSNSLEKAWFARGYFSEARQAYPWAIEASQTVDLPLATAKNYRMWAQACIEQGDYDEAAAHLQQTIEIAEKLGELGEIARAKYTLGRIGIERTDYEDAKNNLAESQSLCEEIGNAAGFADTLYQLAHIPYYQNDYKKAEQLGKQALDIQISLDRHVNAIRTLNLLASIEIVRVNSDTAEAYCLRALEICEEIQEQHEFATTLYTLSDSYRICGELERARENAQNSLDIFKRIGDRKSQAMALYQLGQIDKDIGQLTVALEECKKSLFLSRELKDNWGILYTLFVIGNLYLELNHTTQARDAWVEAAEIALTVQSPLYNNIQSQLRELPKKGNS